MPISAGSIPCPPFIFDQEQHRRAITQWMMRVSPFITTTGTFITAESLSATAGASVIGFDTSGTSLTSTTVQSAIIEVSHLVASSISSGAVSHLMSVSGAATVVLRDWMQDRCSVKDFGAKGDNSADDTVAIQAAINAQLGPVFFPAGNYRFSALSLLDKTVLVGAGRTKTWLKPTATTGNPFVINGKSMVVVESMGFTPATSMSSGSMIYVANSHNVILRDFLIDSKFNTGVLIEGGANQFTTRIEDFEIGNNSGNGIEIGVTSLVQDTFITNGIVASSVLTGIVMTYASGVYISDVDIISCGNASVATYPGTSQYVTAVFMSIVVADTSTLNGFSFFDNGGKVGDITLTNCWSATNSRHGIQCGANVDGLSVVGSRILNNTQNGVQLDGGQNYLFNGNQIYMNSMAGDGFYHGMDIASGTNKFIITNNHIGGPIGHIGVIGGTNLQGYGILVRPGSASERVIAHNNLLLNRTGALSDGGTSLVKFVESNIGVSGAIGGGSATFSDTVVISTTGLGMYIDMTDGADQKIQFKSAGTSEGWLGSTDINALQVINGANTLHVLDIDQSGSATFAKSVTAPQFIGFLSGTAAAALASAGNIGTQSSTVVVIANGLALMLNPADSADQKIQMKNAGTSVGWIGANANDSLRVVNGANTLLTFNADQSGSCTAAKSFNAPLFIGALSGTATTCLSITSGVVTTALSYTPVNPGSAVTLTGTGLALILNPSDSAQQKIQFKDNGTSRGWIGATGTNAMQVINGANTLHVLDVDQSGNVTCPGTVTCSKVIGGAVVEVKVATANGFAGTVANASTSATITLSQPFSGWSNATLNNSWVNFGAPYANAQYWLSSNGDVHLRGVVKSGTIGATIFVLPAGYRPAAVYQFPVVSNLALGIVAVKTGGSVSAVAGSNANFILDNIIFNVN